MLLRRCFEAAGGGGARSKCSQCGPAAEIDKAPGQLSHAFLQPKWGEHAANFLTFFCNKEKHASEFLIFLQQVAVPTGPVGRPRGAAVEDGEAAGDQRARGAQLRVC